MAGGLILAALAGAGARARRLAHGLVAARKGIDTASTSQGAQICGAPGTVDGLEA